MNNSKTTTNSGKVNKPDKINNDKFIKIDNQEEIDGRINIERKRI